MESHNGSEGMDLEKLEKMANLVLEDLSSYSARSSVGYYVDIEARIRNLLVVFNKSLPEHHDFFKTVYGQIDDSYHPLSVENARSAINHILAIIEIEKTSETKIKEMKIFESANEKMKQAGLSFRREDYASTFHNLNTALELVLKDKLRIPTTITKINTSKPIDILIKEKVEPYLYLAEAKKRVIMIDNKIKHQGYSPSKIDCINGIKAMEELISELRDKEIKLSDEIRKKIYEGL